MAQKDRDKDRDRQIQRERQTEREKQRETKRYIGVGERRGRERGGQTCKIINKVKPIRITLKYSVEIFKARNIYKATCEVPKYQQHKA